MNKKIILVALSVLFGLMSHLNAQYLGGSGDGFSMGNSLQYLATPEISNNGPLCEGETLQLQAPLLAGATYHWEGPNGFDSVNVELTNLEIFGVTLQNEGKYYLTITTSGVSNDPKAETDVVIYTLPAAPTAPTGPGLICGLNDTVQTYFTPINPNYSGYLWEVDPPNAIDSFATGGSNAKTIYWSTAYSGTAMVKVAGTNQCGTSPFSEKEVNLMPYLGVSSLPEEDSVCHGAATSLVQVDSVLNADTYQWSIQPGTAGSITALASDTAAEITWDPAFTGIASIILNYANTCYAAYDTLFFKVNDLPAASVVSDQDICDGTNISIGGTSNPNSDYAWSAVPADPSLSGQENIANPTVSPTITTSYTLLETNLITSCSNTNSVTITVLSGVGTADILEDNQTACQGEITSTDYHVNMVQDATDYIWEIEPSSGAGTIVSSGVDTAISVNWEPDFTGTAKIKITASNFCEETADSVTFEFNANPEVNLCPSCTSDTLLLTQAQLPYLLDAGSGFDQYLWSNDSTGSTIEVVSEGWYSVMVWLNNCTDEDSIYIELHIGIDNDDADQYVTIYPNPASKTLNIQNNANNQIIEKIEIIGSYGQMVKAVEKIIENRRIDISNIPSGLYYLKIHYKDFSVNKKLIIQ